MKENHDPNLCNSEKNDGILTYREVERDEKIKMENNNEKGIEISSEHKTEELSDNEYRQIMENDVERRGDFEHEPVTKPCFSNYALFNVTCRKRKSKKDNSGDEKECNKETEMKNLSVSGNTGNECLSFSALLDLIARIIFPLSYFCFVFGYYIKYKECDIS